MVTSLGESIVTIEFWAHAEAFSPKETRPFRLTGEGKGSELARITLDWLARHPSGKVVLKMSELA